MFYQHAAVPRCTTRAERERPRWQSLLNRAIGRPVNLAETDTDQAANRETGTGRLPSTALVIDTYHPIRTSRVRIDIARQTSHVVVLATGIPI